MAGINKIGYSTHILGTVKSVMSCLGIILYDKSKISDGNKHKRISLYNIDEIYKLVIDSDNYLELTRETAEEDDYFKYSHENGRIKGFNVIIYISPVDGSPLGYTEFTNTQGEQRDTNIYLELKADIQDFDVRLNNNLDNVEYAKKEYLGDELKNYTSSKVILEDIKKLEGGNKFYTKFLSQASMTSNSVFLDSGLVTELKSIGDLGFVKLGIEKGMNYSPFDYDFENFGISYYGDDIVLCAWTDLNYCITSLTQKNSFGELIRYTKSNTGYFTLPGDVKKIDYMSGKYIVCDDDSKVFNVENREWLKLSYPRAIVDTLDKTNYLYQLPSSMQSSSFYKYMPELKNMYYDYKDREYIRVRRKVGSWFVLDVMRDSNELILITGLTSCLYITPDQLKDVIFFDDNTLILNTSNAYKIYRGVKRTWYSDDANKLLTGKSGTYTESVRKTADLYSTPFNDLRRGVYPETTGIPNFVAGFLGHLFYVDKSKHIINYL